MNLTAQLTELAAGPPLSVAVERAWTDGRRRRRVRRLRGGAVALAAVGLLALLVPALSAPTVPGFAARPASTVDGHPQRIGRQWFVRNLPARPGPVAALVQVFTGGGATWQAVRSDGHRWRLPEVAGRTDQYPSLSPDGRLLGYLESPDGPYVIRDLASGDRTAFPEIGDNRVLAPTRYHVNGQTPGHFAPDGRHLLLLGMGGPLLLDVGAGSVRQLDLPGVPAGFAGNSELVQLEDPRSAAGGDPVVAGADSEVRAVTADLSGRVRFDVRLRGTAGATVTQWSGVAGTGGLLGFQAPAAPLDQSVGSVQERPIGDPSDQVRRFFLASGLPVQGGPVSVVVSSVCPLAWGSQGQLAVPVLSGDRPRVVDVHGSRSTVTVVAPPLGATCVLWAADALGGPGRGGGLFGTASWPALFYWREVVVAVAAVTGSQAFVRWWRRRRGDRVGRRDRTSLDWHG